MNGKIVAILSAEYFAQVAASPGDGLLEKYGLPGLVIAYFIARDYRQEKREEARQIKKDEAEQIRFAQLQRSIDGLVRVTSIEVMTRPDVASRSRAETEEILNSLPKT